MEKLKIGASIFKTKADFEKNIDFTGMHSDIKPIALYLPQFHTFPENDEWWGKGFTEWTNVKKAKPLFKGHNEPRIPHKSIGYYDLSKVETIKKQVELAKQHGIYGFAIYYYWFSGKKLMEKPIDMLLEHKEIDFPYMLIWANENWTRTWDGQEKNVLIKQNYAEDDPKKFIFDLKKYLDDPRYIRIDGKPVVGFYEATIIPNLEKHLSSWRQVARDLGIGEIFILACATRGRAKKLGYEGLIDGEYDFPPRDKFFGSTFSHANGGVSFSYENLVDKSRIDVEDGNIPYFRGSMLEWDNSARRQRNYHRWAGFSVDKFFIYNRCNVLWARKHLPVNKRFIFINAWNEWGEGTYLEPDSANGFAAINSLSRAIYDVPQNIENKEGILYTNIGKIKIENDSELRESVQICVQAHVFYEDLIHEVISKSNNIPYDFDLYITTTDEKKALFIKEQLSSYSKAHSFYVEIVQNKGRDVIPFIMQLRKVIKNYKYFCHIHSKKSKYSKDGDIWREYLFENLLGSSETVKSILKCFETEKKVGIIFPQNIDLIRKNLEWGGDLQLCRDLMHRLNRKYKINKDKLIFPAGDMFWGKTEALRQIFEIDLKNDEIPEELSQRDGTIMHAIERVWVYLADSNGFTYRQVRSITDNRPLFAEKSFEETSRHISKKLKNSLKRIPCAKLVYRILKLFYRGLKHLLRHGPISASFVAKNKIKCRIQCYRGKLQNRKNIRLWNTRKDFYLPIASFGISRNEYKKQVKTKFARKIKFSLLVPLYNTPEDFLKEMIGSVLFQTYGDWELCLADGSDEQHVYVKKICEEIALKDKRIKYKKLVQNGGISVNTNECLNMASGDFISLFDHDDLLHPSALYETMKVICEKNADFVYTDEAIFKSPNLPEIIWTNFKPDFSPDYFMTCNYICHFTSFNASLLKAIGRFEPSTDGAQDYDFFLRLSEQAKNIIHVPKCLYYWRASESSTAGNTNSKSYSTEAGKKALERHFSRIGVKATVGLETRIPNTYRISYPVNTNSKVSVVIYGAKSYADAKDCITSIAEKTTYKNYEIILILKENNDTHITQINFPENIKILTCDKTVVNSFEQINLGIKNSIGDYIITLEHNVEILTGEWIEEMLMFAQRNENGAIGAKLYYPSGKIEHSGIDFDKSGKIIFVHRHYPKDSIGYVNRLVTVQNYPAVSCACMMFSKPAYNKVDGFDESLTDVNGSVDFCMRLEKNGYRCIWTPYVEAYHFKIEAV